MNLYIWTDTRPVSDSYHREGGLAVVAPSLSEARELVRAMDKAEEWAHYDAARWMLDDPDRTFDVGVVEPEVMTFPNAGCC